MSNCLSIKLFDSTLISSYKLVLIFSILCHAPTIHAIINDSVTNSIKCAYPTKIKEAALFNFISNFLGRQGLALNHFISINAAQILRSSQPPRLLNKLASSISLRKPWIWIYWDLYYLQSTNINEIFISIEALYYTC